MEDLLKYFNILLYLIVVESTLVKVPDTPSLTPLTTASISSIPTTTVAAVCAVATPTVAVSKPVTTTTVSTVTKTKSTVSTLSAGNQEQIVEKAKQVTMYPINNFIYQSTIRYCFESDYYRLLCNVNVNLL